MTVLKCFNAKIAAGKVSARAGEQLLDMLADYAQDAGRQANRSEAEMFRSANATSLAAMAAAFRKADNIRRTIRAQSDIMRGVFEVENKLAALKKAGKAPIGLKGETRTGVYTALSSFLDVDVRELADWNNVTKLARDITGRAHAMFRDAIENMRPGKLGFENKTAMEIDFLRAALDGRTDVAPAAVADAKGWFKSEGFLSDGYIAAGGELAKQERYFPNPVISEAKARALGETNFKQLVRMSVGRDKIIDINTGERMGDAKFERLLHDAWVSIDQGETGAPSDAFHGSGPLAGSRADMRLFQMRDAESWMHFAEMVGEHASPFYAAVEHIHSMAKDTALLRLLGPNPAASLRFMLDVLEREPGRLAVRAEDLEKGGLKEATRLNEKTASRNAAERKSLQNLYAEVAGTNRVPVSSEIARRFADARALLISAQLGSAMVSSLNDLGTMAMTARMNGIPMTSVVRWAVKSIFGQGSEVFAAQTGMIMDTLAHSARAGDQVAGETIRSGIATKLGGAVVRASGMRKWTEGMKHGFALGLQAQVAAERATPFGELEPRFRAFMQRYGIGEAEWKIVGAAKPMEPRPNAVFMSPLDVAALGGKEAQAVSEKLAQAINSAMDYAVLEPTPRVRAMGIGDSKPGTVGGELRRSLAMYRFFSGGMIYMHGGQALARGWDGSRLGHAALTFATVTALGALSMQAKEIIAGRDPRTLDASKEGMNSWAAAILMGGGLGVFGDILQVDKTKYGNSWASVFAGPLAGATEDVLGKFLLGNVEEMIQGKPTHFGGDAAYLLARYTPGTSLWYAKLALQRKVLDQLALMIDPRTPERFARMEQQAQQDRNQQYWWRPGQSSPARAPQMMPGR